jgi:cell division ATPase FtsA
MVSTIVALDLGTTHIRGVEADIKNGHPPKIKKIYSLPIESEIISSGEITNEEGLTKAIKKLWDEAKFKSKYVVAMAGGEAVDTRIQNDVPWSPPEDFKRLLPHYLKDTILLDVDEEYYFDAHTLHEYYKLPESNDSFTLDDAKPVRYKTIMVAAVKQRFSDSLVRAVEAAGLRPYALDILPMALIRSTANSKDIPENASVVSIEIGGDLITIVIHKNLQPIYLDSAPLLGGLRVTSEIAQTLGITLQEAELLKTSFSLNPEQRNELKTVVFGDDGSTTTISYRNFTGTQKEQAAAVVAREVSNLVTHIGDIIEDAFSSTQDAPFRIILSGGGAGLHTLLNRVQSELGIPTVILQPFENYDGRIEPEILANQHIYASVFGLLVGQNEIK